MPEDPPDELQDASGAALAAGHVRAAELQSTRRFPVVFDPPAETTRMALIFLTCLIFSVLGVVLATRAKTQPGPERRREKLTAAAIALAGGLLTMGLISLRFRPGGGHARGVRLELTADDVRIWGRGYGTRIAFRDVARLRFRLVDAYLGRFGGMRQLRVSIEGAGRTIEIACEAVGGDLKRDIDLEGGEGDCVMLDRPDFEAFERELLARVPTEAGGARA